MLDLRTSRITPGPADGDVQNTMVREVFGRDTQADMGDQYTRSRYHHLYINGVYWGVFQTQERVEEFYSETYFGGDEDDYDIVKSGLADVGGTEISEGNDIAWRQLFDYGQAIAANPVANANVYWTMQGLNPDGTRNPALPVLLDAEQLADYMLIIFYTGGFDTGLSRFIGDNVANNWFGIYNRVAADEGFQFFIHDNEHSLGSDEGSVHGTQNIDRTGPFNNGNQNNYAQANPQYLHQDLLGLTEYRQLFIDRVQKFMFNGGALTTDQNIARFMERVNEVDPAVIAEAARWGDSKTSVPRNKTDWQNEINWVVNTYFPTRGDTVLNQLRGDGLYTNFAAPSFSQFGGSVPNNYPLTITAGAGTIYYTTDGVTDPRSIGGGVNPAAAVQQYSGGVPISGTTTVMARLRTAGGQWSGLVEATFSTVTLPGDYNGNGSVEPTDYTVWKSSFGDTVLAGSGADGNGNGLVDTADYAVWRDNMGTSLGLGSGAGSIAATEQLAANDSSAAELTDAAGAVELPLTFFVAADTLPSVAGTTSSLAYSLSMGGGRSAFDNLLLAAERPTSSRPADTTLDQAFDELASDFSATDSELIAVLADDVLGLPDLSL